ncbi:MAG: peptidoglycan editing factor PgeF [Bacteroidetes bacterium]|nr:peptidoglycan editing factor PgeF [Bacteroidota bacterium]
MIQINKSIFYYIFDKQFKELSHIYNEHKYNNKLSEIKINKNKIKNHFSAKKAVFLYQTHSNKIINIKNDYNENILIYGDGMITKNKEILLTIQTADCVPVLLYSENNIIGAAHCGWKGTKNNIIKNIINEMKKSGAKNISAILGPSIHQDSYEVDAEYHKSFLQESDEFHRFFLKSKNANHYLFNLPSFVKHKLKEENINCIGQINHNTYKMIKKYPSYRRSYHLNKRCHQRILSCIIIK